MRTCEICFSAVEDSSYDIHLRWHKRKPRKARPAELVLDSDLAGTLPLIDGTLYRVSKAQVYEWAQAYPGVEVRMELKRFKVWLDANPKHMKTHSGICRAIIHWLSGAQNRSGTNGGMKNHGDANYAILAESLGSHHDRPNGNGKLSQGNMGQADILALFGTTGKGEC